MKFVSLDGMKKYHAKIKELLNGKANSSHTHTKSQISDFPNIPSGVEEGIWTPKCYNDDYSVSNTYNGIYKFGSSAKYIKCGHRVLLTFTCYGISTTETKSATPKIATSSFPFVFDKVSIFGNFVQEGYTSPVKGVITFDRARNAKTDLITLYKFEKSVDFHSRGPGYTCAIEYITTQ